MWVAAALKSRSLTAAFLVAWWAGFSSGQVVSRGAPPAMPASKLPPAFLTEPRGVPFEVAPIDRSARASVEEAASRIDAILEARQRADGVKPGENLDDAAFVRRAYLQLGGRIPTCDEALRFLAGQKPGRRAELIDSLLESPDYVSRFYSVWADTLRLGEGVTPHIYVGPYLDWVKRSIAENRPYDEWVREMLTSDGTILDNPAVGYQLRDAGMPLEYVDLTVRVFLGTQIGCAQCHDHPFAPWTRRQFYELAAFTYGDPTGLSPVRGPDGKALTEIVPEYDVAWKYHQGELGEASKSLGNAFAPYFIANNPLAFLMNNARRVAYRPAPLPTPPQLKREPGNVDVEPVIPRILWGEVPPDAAGSNGRDVFARWVTDRENRQFAKTIANRMWHLLFGVGIVDPIDDFGDAHPPSHPELLEHLADEVLRVEFDIREFVRIVCNTRAWQRRAVPHDPSSGETFAFTAPALKRMSAEQVWDSLLTLVAHDIWAYQRPTFEDWASSVRVDISPERIDLEAVKESFVRSVAGPNGERRSPIELAGLRYRFDWVRASEMPTPLGLTHPLRIMGQSDRTTVNGGRVEASMAQVLFLLNDWALDIIVDPGSKLMQTVLVRPPREGVDALFFSILARRPDDEERAMAEKAISRAPSPHKGVINVIFALLNTREFLFIQ